MEIKLDYSDISFKNNGKLKLLIIVGTRPEIIRLAAVINKARQYFDCILAHTGQNYDYNLNGVFFKDLKLRNPEVYMDAVGDDLGATVGNIINCSYKLMASIKPDAMLVLGDTNSCLSAIPAKRLHIPIFHMEAGNRCKDECLPEETNRRIVDIISDVNLAYSEHARKYLHECGADYVTVFQETYDSDKYEQLHLLGHKRVWPYRFDAQERALRGGMRGVAFSALLGLSDFRKDALASALHVYYLQRKYPHAEMSLSCPRLRPIINNDKINPLDVHEKQLCQIICAYRIFLPFVGITVSSRESAEFRNGIVKIAATKVSAGVSTGIGDHESKYSGKESDEVQGDEQFEIDDNRSLDKMYKDIEGEGLQPVLNDYLYV